VFLKIDWKLIFCGDWEKAKSGKRIRNMTFGYMILDFMLYREYLQDKTLR
jgi:hypothetical protein